MEIAGFYVAQAVDGERRGFGEYTLRAVVLVLAVFILEIYRGGRREHLHVDAFGADVVYGFNLARGERRDQQKSCGIQVCHTVGEIKGSPSGHVDGVARCHDFVECYVADAADVVCIVHF